jgi:hypothetical protein
MVARPDVVEILTNIDVASFITGDYVRNDGARLTPAEVELAKSATAEEVGAARDVIARRLNMHAVGGGSE